MASLMQIQEGDRRRQIWHCGEWVEAGKKRVVACGTVQVGLELEETRLIGMPVFIIA